MNNLLVVLGLGLAGVDLVGILLMVTALAAGFSKRKLLTHAGLVLLGTVILGVILSELLGKSLTQLGTIFDNLSNSSWIVISLMLIVDLSFWGFYRLKHANVSDENNKATQKGIYGMAAFMVFYGYHGSIIFGCSGFIRSP